MSLDKVVGGPAEAVAGIRSGASVAVGGFGPLLLAADEALQRRVVRATAPPRDSS